MLAACHDDAAPPPAVIAQAATRPAAPPPPVTDLSLGDGFAMRRPLRDGRLAVIPIVATGVIAEHDFVSLATAVAAHTATVHELPRGWQVSAVQITHRGPGTLVAYAGELVFEGKQDRVLAETRVIAPGQTADVAVRCVEESRDFGDLGFTVPGVIAELELRRVVAFRGQVDVWDEIHARDHELGVSSPTKAYRDVLARAATGEAAARRARLASALAAHPDRDRLVGLAAVVDGEVIAIDRFATPALYREEEAELLGAYVVGSDGAAHEGRTFLPSDVRALATTTGQIWTSDATFTALRSL